MLLNQLLNILLPNGYTLDLGCFEVATDCGWMTFRMRSSNGFVMDAAVSCVPGSTMEDLSGIYDYDKPETAAALFNSIDPSMFIVDYIRFTSWLTSQHPEMSEELYNEPAITLLDGGNAGYSGFYYPLIIENVNRMIKLHNSTPVEIMLDLLPQVTELCSYIKNVVQPVLEKADYTCTGFEMLNNYDNSDNTNWCFCFLHKHHMYTSGMGLSIDIWLDKFTGKIKSSLDSDEVTVTGHTRESLWDELMEKVWKREGRVFEYLYNHQLSADDITDEYDFMLYTKDYLKYNKKD